MQVLIRLVMYAICDICQENGSLLKRERERESANVLDVKYDDVECLCQCITTKTYCHLNPIG